MSNHRCPMGGGRSDCPCKGKCWNRHVRNAPTDWKWMVGMSGAALLAAGLLAAGLLAGWALLVA